MTATRKHFIRRLSRLTGIPALRIGLAFRRDTLAELAQRTLRVAHPDGVV